MVAPAGWLGRRAAGRGPRFRHLGCETDTASGRYRLFAELLRHDGYTVVAGRTAIDRGALQGVDVLVIANALPPDGPVSVRYAGADGPGKGPRQTDPQ